MKTKWTQYWSRKIYCG